MDNTRDIKYLNKNFSDFRTQLIEFAKNYFPDTYNDFSPSSPGMMFIEMASYVGDVLSFYQDTQLQETFLQHAKDPGNLYNLAYMFGYRPKISSIAEVEVDISQEVDALPTTYEPNFSQAVVIGENSIVTSRTGGSTNFFFPSKVDFAFSSSLDPTDVEILTLSGVNPATYKLTKKAKLLAGEIRSIDVTFGTGEKFSSVTIEDENVTNILSITGSDASEWYEVPYLGQETLFTETRNSDPLDNGKVYNSLVLRKVPRRFTTRYNSSGQLTVQFGAGVLPSEDENFLPSISNVGLGTNTGVNRLDYAYDPSNFLYSRSYGLAPSNVTLNIKYLVSNGINDNVPANTVTELTSINNLGSSSKFNTLSITNPFPAQGGSDGDTVEELRQNTLRAFNEQGRVVTLEDYKVRALSLPPTLGSLAKVYVQRDQLSNSTTSSTNSPLSLYTLTYDIEGKLSQTTPTLKNNLKKYLSQYMILTDSVNITDAFIINIGVEYEIKVFPNFVSREILLKCNRAISNYLGIERIDINMPINLTELQLLLGNIKGVQVVQKLKITNKVGAPYSPYGYDVEGATKNNIVYPSLDPSIFEVKYPQTDIKGRVI